MANYIDGYTFPIALAHLNEYGRIAEAVADIWKEYGALAYFEYAGEDLEFESTLSFPELLDVKQGETVVFGWIVFDSREARDFAHKKVASDPRMTDLVSPLMDPSRMIFDAKRMVYGGFKPLVLSTK